MAGGISVHAVDVARGRPAQGMQVDIYALTHIPEKWEPVFREGCAPTQESSMRKVIASGRLAASGALDHPIVSGDGVKAGTYEVVFHVGDYLRATGAPTSTPPFLDLVPFRFTVADAAQHYHLPFKFTPWGFSLFRGS
jgi:5-hydroxyisourate hydrolase